MKNLKITIPEPCHEDWSKMTKTDKGKFCNSCAKEVFDFTTFSDEQLIKQFEKEGDLCGRVTTKQLDRDLVLQRKKQQNYLPYAFSGIFSLFLLNSSPSKAQEKPKTIQTDKNFVSIPLQNTRVKNNITVSGTVLDETNMPLPGATVLIKGTTNGTSTDFDGKFSLDCKKTDILIFGYVGYFEQELPVKKAAHVNLTLDKSLGDAVVTSLGFVRKQDEITVAGGISVKDCSTDSTTILNNLTVSGTVVDELNSPLPDAIIIIKDKNTGTTTNIDGKFNIECKKNDTLIISYIGYQDVLHKVVENSNTSIKLVLEEEEALGEMITIYGKKRWFGGRLFTRFTNLFRKHNKNAQCR